MGWSPPCPLIPTHSAVLWSRVAESLRSGSTGTWSPHSCTGDPDLVKVLTLESPQPGSSLPTSDLKLAQLKECTQFSTVTSQR